jgi:hypothetical protein
MPRKCSICNHPNRQDIDTDLVNNESFRIIADRYYISVTSLQRHKKHLPKDLVKSVKDRETLLADTLLDQIKSLQRKALKVLSVAEESGDLRVACMAIRETRGTLELLAKVTGEMDDRPQVNIHMAPEWVTLRTLILKTLEPFPEARMELIRELSEANPC